MIYADPWPPGSESETRVYVRRAKGLSDHLSPWPDRGVSFRRLRNSCGSRWPRLFVICKVSETFDTKSG